ncbi:hypothetical protein [Paractinoplanes deccanensis]|nr:hypothetical protein [Actinoplanes deccanensis]
MPDKELTVAQRMTLLALMIKAGTLPRTFLANTVKISLDKTKRTELVAQKLITVTESPIILELTEEGWGRAIQEFEKGVPQRGGALGGTLYLLLGFLRAHFERNDLSAAEFFASISSQQSPGFASTPEPADDSDIEAEIRRAYDGAAPRPGAYVMLEDLRKALPSGFGAGAVDDALLRLDRAPDVHLIPESNQKVLTRGQRDAAIRIGNQDMHLLAIRAR